MTSRSISRKTFKSREFLSHRIIVALSNFCLALSSFCPAFNPVMNVHAAWSMRGKLRTISIVWGVYMMIDWLTDSSQGNFIPRDSSLFFTVSFSRKIVCYSNVTVIFRSISMSLSYSKMLTQGNHR